MRLFQSCGEIPPPFYSVNLKDETRPRTSVSGSERVVKSFAISAQGILPYQLMFRHPKDSAAEGCSSSSLSCLVEASSGAIYAFQIAGNQDTYPSPLAQIERAHVPTGDKHVNTQTSPV